ncbi:hypothetical protein NGRA_1988 [Nosema granulosis]|uniref:Uncharacterized protein n=1 Tax=Nosema granulosis TaxID=83296 RepID=A0A9P6GXH6_9MICR|nr:hypothetical protein NGRA_1988 [Nosema granulosis]
MERDKRLPKYSYPMWKEYMLGIFEKKMSTREFLRQFQKKDESDRCYFERMRSHRECIFENDELIFEVALLGLRFYKEETLRGCEVIESVFLKMMSLFLKLHCLDSDFIKKRLKDLL